MARFAFLSMFALIASACASRGTLPPATAGANTAHVQPAHATTRPAHAVELRHFYLLSPGPSSTLVVTRSDIAPANR